MPLVHTTRLPSGSKFSRRKADKVSWFVEHACVHTKSSYKGKPFILADWQKGSAKKNEEGIWEVDGIITPLFGAQRWSDMHKKYVRRFTMAWLEMARKNGKSEIMAALGLYLLIFDGEWGAEVYGAASDRDQAAMVFDVARDMCYLSPMLKRMVDKGELVVVDSRKRIVYTPTKSFYRVIAADATGNLGANPHAILFDEVLAQPDNKLWNYLRQGFGVRPQPMLLSATTAGPDRESFAYAEHEFSLKVGEHPDEDPKRFVFMAFMDEKDDWRDESKWGEANPALSTNGGFLDVDVLRAEMQETLSKGDLSEVSLFKIFRLNQWGTASNLWLDIHVWDDSEEVIGDWDDSQLAGVSGVGGFDLGETTDFSSWVVVFYLPDGRVLVKPRFYITKRAIEQKHKKRSDQMQQWIEGKYVTVFASEVHNYDRIRDDMMEDIATYGIKMFGYDPFQAPGIVSHIEDKTSAIGVKQPQTTTRQDAGAKELTRLLGLRAFSANKHPILRWNANNAGFKSDAEGHVKPHKANSTGNIDGVAALVNALCTKVGTPVDPDGDIFVFDDDEPWEEDD